MYLRTQVQSDEIMTEITASSTGGSRDSYTRAQVQSVPISAHQCHQWRLAMASTGAINAYQCPSVPISAHQCHQWQLAMASTGAINAYQCPSVPSVATRNGPHRWLRAAHISCGHYQWASPVISGGHQRPSEAISGHQSPSAHHP